MNMQWLDLHRGGLGYGGETGNNPNIRQELKSARGARGASRVVLVMEARDSQEMEEEVDHVLR